MAIFIICQKSHLLQLFKLIMKPLMFTLKWMRAIWIAKFLEEDADKNLKTIALEDLLSWVDKNAK